MCVQPAARGEFTPAAVSREQTAATLPTEWTTAVRPSVWREKERRCRWDSARAPKHIPTMLCSEWREIVLIGWKSCPLLSLFRVCVWAVPVGGVGGAAGGGSGSKGPAGAQRAGEQCSTSSTAEAAGSFCRAAPVTHHSGQPPAGRALPSTASPR